MVLKPFGQELTAFSFLYSDPEKKSGYRTDLLSALLQNSGNRTVGTGIMGKHCASVSTTRGRLARQEAQRETGKLAG
jgi:hypothetical protein